MSDFRSMGWRMSLRKSRYSKSGFVCEDERRKNVRKPRSGFTQDVFSAEVWLASSPLHEAGKTTKSGDTLKPGIRREELGSASDTLSSAPNACPLISTFSKPHSEVTSATHIPALKGSFEKALRCFLVSSSRKVPRQMQRLKNVTKRELLRQKRTPPQPTETHNAGETSSVNDKIHFAGRIL